MCIIQIYRCTTCCARRAFASASSLLLRHFGTDLRTHTYITQIHLNVCYIYTDAPPATRDVPLSLLLRHFGKDPEIHIYTSYKYFNMYYMHTDAPPAARDGPLPRHRLFCSDTWEKISECTHTPLIYTYMCIIYIYRCTTCCARLAFASALSLVLWHFGKDPEMHIYTSYKYFNMYYIYTEALPAARDGPLPRHTVSSALTLQKGSQNAHTDHLQILRKDLWMHTHTTHKHSNIIHIYWSLTCCARWAFASAYCLFCSDTSERISECTHTPLTKTLNMYYSQLHLDCHLISISNLNLLGLFFQRNVVHETWRPRSSIAMGWLRLVGPLQLQVSFAKETCNFKEPTNHNGMIQETWRTRSSIEIGEWRNDNPNVIGCTCTRMHQENEETTLQMQ